MKRNHGLHMLHRSEIDREQDYRDAHTSLAACRKAIGEKVRAVRVRDGLSLRELARRCNVSAPMMRDFELGRRWSDDLWFAVLAELTEEVTRGEP